MSPLAPQNKPPKKQVTALIADASDRNFERWRDRLARPAEFPLGWRSQWANATAELQRWVLARAAWLDGAFAKVAEPGAGPDAFLAAAGAVAGAAAPVVASG